MRSPLNEVFEGDDVDKCSYKSVVTGNGVKCCVHYYENKLGVCLSV